MSMLEVSESFENIPFDMIERNEKELDKKCIYWDCFDLKK